MTDTIDTILDIIEEGFAPDDWPNPPSQAVLDACGPDAGEELRAQYAAALEAWHIDGENTAVWAATKLRRALAKREAAAEVADRMRALADAHEAKIERETDHDVRYFHGELVRYLFTVTEGTRKQSITLADGTKLAWSVGGVSLVLDDPTGADDDPEQALAEWCEDHAPDAVVYPKPKVDKAALKKVAAGKVDPKQPGHYPAVLADGTIAPRCRLVRGERNAKITLGELAPEPDVDEGGIADVDLGELVDENRPLTTAEAEAMFAAVDDAEVVDDAPFPVEAQ